METKMKRCQQCGEIKAHTMFRQYPGRKGTYKICLTCEKINNRYKYLTKLERPHLESETEEVRKIEKLYDLLGQRGFKTPLVSRVDELMLDVDAMLRKQEDEIAKVQELGDEVPMDTPEGLLKWLTESLYDMDADEVEDLGDQLMAKYRPQTGVDASMNPVYNDSYRSVLQQVLKRFDDYVDSLDD